MEEVEELSYYKTSEKFPYFSDFEGQNLMPGEVKPLRQTARVTEFEAKGLLIKVEKPQEVEVEEELTAQPQAEIAVETPIIEEIVTPIANVRNNKGKS